MKVRVVVSMIDNDVRKKGEALEVVGDFRGKRFKYLAKDGKVYSSEKNKGWKVLTKRYEKGVE